MLSMYYTYLMEFTQLYMVRCYQCITHIEWRLSNGIWSSVINVLHIYNGDNPVVYCQVLSMYYTYRVEITQWYMVRLNQCITHIEWRSPSGIWSGVINVLHIYNGDNPVVYG